MNKRIRVNGTLYEAVEPRRNRSRLNESFGGPIKASDMDEIGADTTMAEGSEPLAEYHIPLDCSDVFGYADVFVCSEVDEELNSIMVDVFGKHDGKKVWGEFNYINPSRNDDKYYIKKFQETCKALKSSRLLDDVADILSDLGFEGTGIS